VGHTVLFEQNGKVGIITLNRPDVVNAVNEEMQVELAEILLQVKNNENIRAVVLTGAGPGFCAGGDVKRMLSNFAKTPADQRVTLMENLVHNWLTLLINMEKPVISAVHGYAVGAGLSIALATDIIVAARSTIFSMAFSQVGLLPDLSGLFFLARTLGVHRAKELIFTAERFSAEKAYELGLVNRVVDDDLYLDEAMNLAKQLAEGPTRAYGYAKKLLHLAPSLDLNTFFEYERLYQSLVAETEDFREGVNAFIEKRPPKFKGR